MHRTSIAWDEEDHLLTNINFDEHTFTVGQLNNAFLLNITQSGYCRTL